MSCGLAFHTVVARLWYSALPAGRAKGGYGVMYYDMCVLGMRLPHGPQIGPLESASNVYMYLWEEGGKQK